MIGEIPGMKIGQVFKDRQALHDAGVHRATQAGITGKATEGAESIVLSGGYVDDEDYGDTIIYTGHGGRDPNTGEQVFHQEFTRQNQAHVTGCRNGMPVRVVRREKRKSSYSPESGYSYGGLYIVEKYWIETGINGFQVCRFRLVSSALNTASVTANAAVPAARAQTVIQRIIRGTALGRKVKSMYKYNCQVCGITLQCEGGLYAEAAHIRPLGSPHNGPDTMENILCLCPNHHVLFDNGGLTLSDDLVVALTGSQLIVHSKHTINVEHIRYQRLLWE